MLNRRQPSVGTFHIPSLVEPVPETSHAHSATFRAVIGLPLSASITLLEGHVLLQGRGIGHFITRFHDKSNNPSQRIDSTPVSFKLSLAWVIDSKEGGKQHLKMSLFYR